VRDNDVEESGVGTWRAVLELEHGLPGWCIDHSGVGDWAE
jgi:hypothetical protein